MKTSRILTIIAISLSLTFATYAQDTNTHSCKKDDTAACCKSEKCCAKDSECCKKAEGSTSTATCEKSCCKKSCDKKDEKH